jgi:uncharacterized protein
MSASEENSPGSLTATGPVRLFPLPNLVMFPHVVQPLHIFEPRYCDMLEDALADDRQIAMVLLQPGWERNYEGRPPISTVACLGKIIGHERLPTGRHSILLRGQSRIIVRRELPPDQPFRLAEAEVLEDFYPPAGAARRPRGRRQLVNFARELMPDSAELHEQLDELLEGQVSLGMLTDIFAFTLGFPTAVKQRLLAECNVDCRASLLNERLQALVDRLRSDWPGENDAFGPRFSLN